MKRPKAFWALALLILASALARPASAALQFDVLAGYEGTVHEAAWFPITCELFNDGPSFNATIEISAGQFGGDQVRQVPVELPTNTRKRIIIPFFAGSAMRQQGEWTGRLLDAKGKVVAERTGVSARIVPWESVVMGSLARNFGGSPTFPEIQQGRPEVKPEVARMTVDQFPDNPITLEGMNAFYLNSEKAPELKAGQVTALLAWVRGGGHLIVAVEEAGDINATPWLKQFLPMDLSATTTMRLDEQVLNWIRSQSASAEADQPLQSLQRAGRRPGRRMQQATGNAYLDLPYDAGFKDAELPVATGRVKDGYTLFTTATGPLCVQAPRGRGKVTLLTFSPEREPFRSWKARGYFWAKLAGIPGEFFTSINQRGWGASSVDGLFGALIDSRQIRKLPVSWLLLLLVVYLLVIGPFDQWWLKKIGKQMLTWITFPAYVVLFSLLIYFIGYKLRAGETEWNELNIVDVLPRGDEVDLRGRNYISIYSSRNAWYAMNGEKGHAALRTELSDFRGMNRDSGKAKVVQVGNTFKADVMVPVWTSLLYANDWMKTNDTPFIASVREMSGGYDVNIENFLDKPLSEVHVVVGQMVYELPVISARQKKTIHLAPDKGTSLRSFVQQNGAYFQKAVDVRRSPMGDTAGGQLDNRPLTAMTASFLSYLDELSPNGRSFIAPPGLDLTPQVERGDAVVFAWLPNFGFAEKINDFSPPRFRRDTLLRLTVPVH
jgi:hypothetical protein